MPMKSCRGGRKSILTSFIGNNSPQQEIEMPEPIAWVALFEQKSNTYLMTHNGTIHGFRSQEDALAYFGDSYCDAHQRGIERSMSAVMHWITFQPAVVPLYTEHQLQDWIEADEDGKAAGVSFYAVCGVMTGVKIKDSVVKELKEIAITPDLVKNEYTPSS